MSEFSHGFLLSRQKFHVKRAKDDSVGNSTEVLLWLFIITEKGIC